MIVSKWLIQTGVLWGRAVPQDHRRAGRRERRAAVLAAAGAGDLAAELERHELRAVADAEHRDAEVVDAGVDARGALDVDRRGTTAEDHARGPPCRDLGCGDRVGHDLGVDVRLAHPPRDQLGVLRAEVDDEDGVERLGRRHR